MDSRPFNPTPLLLAFGLTAFGLAGLSVADMFADRPYDGIVPVADIDDLIVSEVVPGSGADRARLEGEDEILPIEAGDEILGINNTALRGPAHAAEVVTSIRPSSQKGVPYLIKKPGKRIATVVVDLGRRRIGDGTFVYHCTLGFSFFLLGLFVLVRQPGLRASQVFFVLCGLFLIFLVCRMRPRSYSGLDTLILRAGTTAFLMLPAAFLQFYLLFPRPAWLEDVAARSGWRWLESVWRRAWPLLYALPPLVFAARWLLAVWTDEDMTLIYGAPSSNWWLMALYMVLGLIALGANARRLKGARERRGMALVVFGSFFGLVPFLISSLAFTGAQHSRTFFFFGVMPLALVPLTFTYAIVRFQLLDIRVILRRSLLYTVTTALLTGLYAGGIATFYVLFRGTTAAQSQYFPIFFALAIVVLFDSFRGRVQEVIDRYFFAGRSQLEQAMLELGEAMSAQVDLQAVVEELVEKLPRILGLRFAALYLLRGYSLERAAGPDTLPDKLPVLPELQRHLQRRASLTRLDQLGSLPLRSPEVARLVETLDDAGVEALGDLASQRRHIGMVLFSRKAGQIPLEREEVELLQRLLHQAAVALETSLLLDEHTQRAELEREMQIAATIQAQLLPDKLTFAEGWTVAAACRPARIVGGDFFAELPTGTDGRRAVIFADVSGKSVSAAMMMMAAHEALFALAMTRPAPAELFALTNRRLYDLGKRSFVALGYFRATDDGRSLRYLLAGQPPPLVRHKSGRVSELPLPEHRIPVGALEFGEYRELQVALAPGDLVLGYSDGVTEARSPGGEFFGVEKLCQVVAAAPPEPQPMIDAVLDAVDDFTQGGLQYDDLTLVAVGRQVI